MESKEGTELKKILNPHVGEDMLCNVSHELVGKTITWSTTLLLMEWGTMFFGYIRYVLHCMLFLNTSYCQ